MVSGLRSVEASSTPLRFQYSSPSLSLLLVVARAASLISFIRFLYIKKAILITTEKHNKPIKT